MTTATDRLAALVLGLPQPRVRGVRLSVDLPIPMDDGEVQLADRYVPVDDEAAPLVLLRGPYGRRSSGLLARLIAGQGYQVLIISLRGTAGSGGRFEGWRLEPRDGAALMRWLRAQPWFPGAMATWGASFLGYSQWALASESIPEWRAAVISDAPSEVHDTFLYRGGALAWKDWLGWAQRMQNQIAGKASVLRNLLPMRADARRLDRAVDTVPADEADVIATGEHVHYVQEWLRHPEPGEYWASTDQRTNVVNLPPLVFLTGGWRDVFLPGTLSDFTALRAAGRSARLLVGPWSHGRAVLTRGYLRDIIAVFDHALRDAEEALPDPVRIHVGGIKQWREYADWPPVGHPEQTWYLHPDGLAAHSPSAEPSTPSASGYRYDPADPTPSADDPELVSGRVAKDNRAFEERPDVLTFSGSPLTEDLEVVGPVTAGIHLRLDREHTDVVVRLCDVLPTGVSQTVCMGIRRLGPQEAAVDGAADGAEAHGGAGAGPGVEVGAADGVRRAEVELWPTAYRFRRGHRLRVHVCSGAHPLYLRNLGTGDQLGTAMVAAEQQVLHNRAYPSAIRLPVASPTPPV